MQMPQYDIENLARPRYRVLVDNPQSFHDIRFAETLAEVEQKLQRFSLQHRATVFNTRFVPVATYERQPDGQWTRVG